MDDVNCIINENGGTEWRRKADGKLHREDGPAVVSLSGKKKEWYRHGLKHREDGPAVEWSDGDSEWWFNGELHREDGPAIERADGTKEWYLYGEHHCEDGPAIKRSNGDKEWWLKRKRHREDGPAVERADGTKEWWIDGNLHCENGPAIINSDGWCYWYRNHERHREDGPAAYNHKNGRFQFWVNGEVPRSFEWQGIRHYVHEGDLIADFQNETGSQLISASESKLAKYYPNMGLKVYLILDEIEFSLITITFGNDPI
ncbi:hypothetical protein [Novosphingobium sp. EMRT-2]|uniref:hypothetical protein n=1 Tax=Novosphingobium sp. EMRT-2 TaxID=2571749 RepID=UPI0010BE0E74|nr:hypothetical protein [Novosphingobium sp. EMRT-2]QCI92574.1 hypothetical protein FA702_02725 [Novosphingobium sp. EMRT-2]